MNNNNTLKMSKGACVLNGVPVERVTYFSVSDFGDKMEATLTFEIDRENFRYEHQTEKSDYSGSARISVMIDGKEIDCFEIPETEGD